ncbi:DUF3108 domain-containing protein [Thiolapillus sp.]
MSIGRKRPWLPMALLLVSPVLPFAETLHYEASYTGVFSAGEILPIAAVRLDSNNAELPVPEKAIQLTMEVTSAPYPFVERHFPFRVRYRSIYAPRGQQVLALEKYEKTSRLKHEINWVDAGQGKLMRFRPKGKSAGEQLFPAVLQPWLKPGQRFEFHKYARHPVEDGLLDWLSMLQVMREKPLATGQEYVFSVTDGKRLYRYHVRVRKKQQIEAGGKKQLAWKLRFDAVEEGKRQPAHRPLYVWLADDAGRTPLLFENRHPLGRFVVRLSAVQ